MVTFIVGKENVKQTFVNHKNLATSNSGVFKAAFDGNFLEGHTQSMRLEDVESRIFGYFVQWLYDRTFPYGSNLQDDELPLITYAKLWTLAGRCLVTTLQDELAMQLRVHLKARL